jgi:hypothetical protein
MNSSKRVLIVDDDQTFACFVEKVAGGLGTTLSLRARLTHS